jgi:hypothetical protein
MDVERIIDDIEQLQEMFEAPDIRPLRQATFLLRIEGTTKRSRIARGFGFGVTIASVADLSLRYSDCLKSRPKLPQEFRTRIGETYSRIELECFPRRSKWTGQFRPKT